MTASKMNETYYKCDNCERIFPEFSYTEITLDKFEPFKFKPSFNIARYSLFLCPDCLVKAIQEWAQALPEEKRAKKYITATRAAEKLGIHVEAVKHSCETGDIPAIKTENGWFIDPDKLKLFITNPQPREPSLFTEKEIEILKYLLYERAKASRIAEDCGIEFTSVSQILLRGIKRGLIRGEIKDGNCFYFLTKEGQRKVEKILF